MIETKLYLGLSRKDDPEVTRQQLRDFFCIHVSPRFDGFTIQDVTGYWKGEYEDTVVLIFIHDNRDIDIDKIAEAYCILFDQECVLRTDTEVSTSFVSELEPRKKE